MIEYLPVALIVAAYAYVCWHDRKKPEPVATRTGALSVMTSEPEPEEPDHTYELVLMHPSGEFVGSVAAPKLPRHFYIVDGRGFISDNPNAPEGALVHAFDRVGSSVYVDNERDALFVRRV